MSVNAAAVSPSLLSGLGGTAPTTQVGTQANDAQMNEFLHLLTTQLQYQDPTKPTDPTQFVSQLAQFSTVEQLTKSNTTLGSIQQSLSGMALGQYAGMVGKTVNAAVTSLSVPASGSVSMNLNYQVTASSPKHVQAVIANAAGTVVGALPLQGSSGSVTFDGTNGNGQPLAPGQYTVAVVGQGASGASQSAGTLTSAGTVSSVVQDANGGWQLQLKEGGTVEASAVTSVD